MLIADKLFIAAGGWIKRPGCVSLNHYRPPLIDPGNAAQADMWIDHIHKVYPDDREHIIHWLAHRVQHPGEKINHALLLGGAPGIGKDSLFEPVRYAVGPWNVTEVTPVTLLGRFNGFLKSVILRVSEAHDMGEYSRFSLYERMKSYTAAPPDGLRIDEKNLREHTIVNCCGVLLTTNHPTDSLYLPADDRRFYVAWSTLTQADFVADYWRRLWGWYNAGGIRHVAAYLAELDLTKFDPKAPPPKTSAFWAMVAAARAPEDAEIADALDALGNPAALTLDDLRAKAGPALVEWLDDRRNKRAVQHRLNACGYGFVSNPDAQDGYWKISKARRSIYARLDLSVGERLTAARARQRQGLRT
jgi:hypothetical protein